MMINKKNLNVKKIFYLLLYYLIFRYLPSSRFYLVGSIGKYLRSKCCQNIFLSCGKNINVERGAFFASGTRIVIGDNSGIGINCVIPADTIIGNNVLMGPNCHIFGANHRYLRTDIPIIDQGFESPKQTIIEDDVWIGRGVIITPGRKIAQGSIIAAGCVLTKDFPPYTVIGGNPSRIIKYRK